MGCGGCLGEFFLNRRTKYPALKREIIACGDLQQVLISTSVGSCTSESRASLAIIRKIDLFSCQKVAKRREGDD